jgi:hypothetical protein
MPTHREGKNSSESTLIFGKAVYKPDHQINTANMWVPGSASVRNLVC